jgi:hypothetical protein
MEGNKALIGDFTTTNFNGCAALASRVAAALPLRHRFTRCHSPHARASGAAHRRAARRLLRRCWARRRVALRALTHDLPPICVSSAEPSLCSTRRAAGPPSGCGWVRGSQRLLARSTHQCRCMRAPADVHTATRAQSGKCPAATRFR